MYNQVFITIIDEMTFDTRKVNSLTIKKLSLTLRGSENSC